MDLIFFFFKILYFTLVLNSNYLQVYLLTGIISGIITYRYIYLQV